VRAGEKCSISTIALIGSQPRAFQRAIDEPCTLPLSPLKGGIKRDFAGFSNKIQLWSKKVCYNVSLCENFQRHSCSYLIPLSNGYVADDLGWPLSTLNHLNFYISHCLMHLRNWRSQRLQIWCKGWMCKSQPMDRQTIPDRVVVRSRDPLKILGASVISLERLNLNSSNFIHRYAISILARGWHITNNRGVVMVTWLFWNFAVCRDAARRAGPSATAELLLYIAAVMWCAVLDF